jgi:hypothetical protein
MYFYIVRFRQICIQLIALGYLPIAALTTVPIWGSKMDTSLLVTYTLDERATNPLDTTIGIWGDYDNIPE